MGYTIRVPSPRALAALRKSTNFLIALKALAVAIALIALYFQDLNIVFNDALNNEVTSYIIIIPFLLAYLVYRKRKMLRAAISTKTQDQPKNTQHLQTLAGTLLCVIAILLYWSGSYTFTPLEYHMLTLPLFAAGLTLALFNLQTLRQAFFPIVFLLFLAPPPSEILYGLGSILSVVSSEVSTAIVNVFGIPATLSGEFGTPTIVVTRPDSSVMNFSVDVACSGIYSLIGFVVFGAFVAFIVRDKLWKKALTFAIGFPLIYLLNVLRITIIIGIGYQIGEQLALDVFHLLGGWVLIFLGTLLLLLISEKIIKTQIFGRKQTPCISCKSDQPLSAETYCKACGRILKHPQTRSTKIDITKIATLVLATMLLLSLQTPVFAATRGPAQILIQTPDGEQGSTQLFPEISNYTIMFQYRDTEFERVSKQDLSLIYLYAPQQEDKQPVWIVLEIAGTTIPLHRWETCLVTWPQTHGYQPGVTQLELRDIQILDNPLIIGRYFGFQYRSDNQIQLVLYWYETNAFTINNSTQQEHVKLSLIVYPDKPEDIPKMETQLQTMAIAVASYWQPIKTMNLFSMLIRQQGTTMAAAITTLVIAIAVFYLFELNKRKQANRILYQKLSQPNQQLISIIQKTQKATIPTLNNIEETYRRTTGDAITIDQLEQKIVELEKTGIVKSRIISNQDQPTQTWRV